MKKNTNVLAVVILVGGALISMGIAWANGADFSTHSLSTTSSTRNSVPTSYFETVRPSGNERRNGDTSGVVYIEGILVEYRNATAFGTHLKSYWEANKQAFLTDSPQDILSLSGDNLPSIHDTDFRRRLEEEMRNGEAIAMDMLPANCPVGESVEIHVPNLTRISNPFATDRPAGSQRKLETEQDFLPIRVTASVAANNIIRMDVQRPQYALTGGDTVASLTGPFLNFVKETRNEKTFMVMMGFIRRTGPQNLSMAILYLTPSIAATNSGSAANK